MFGSALFEDDLLGIDAVHPGRRVLPAVPHPLPNKDASGILHLVPFHAIDDVVSVVNPAAASAFTAKAVSRGRVSFDIMGFLFFSGDR